MKRALEQISQLTDWSESNSEAADKQLEVPTHTSAHLLCLFTCQIFAVEHP